MSLPTIACALRTGGAYDAEYVERLSKGVARHLPGARFVCFSNAPVPCESRALAHGWPGWWSKMEFFRPDAEDLGDLLTLDLDTIVCGPLDAIAAATETTMLSDFLEPARPASGAMFLPRASRAEVWARWTADPEGHMARCGSLGDQKFLEEVWGLGVARWQDRLPGQIVSYKAHVRRSRGRAFEEGDGTIPEGARLVCFHGRPRPREVNWLEGPLPLRIRLRDGFSRIRAALGGEGAA